MAIVEDVEELSFEDRCKINDTKIQRLRFLFNYDDFTRDQIILILKHHGKIHHICENPLQCTICKWSCTLKEEPFIGRHGELICPNCM